MSPAQILASSLSPYQREALLVILRHPIWELSGANASGSERRMMLDGIVTRVHYITVTRAHYMAPEQQRLSHITMLVLTVLGFEVARLLTCPIEAELRERRFEALRSLRGGHV